MATSKFSGALASLRTPKPKVPSEPPNDVDPEPAAKAPETQSPERASAGVLEPPRGRGRPPGKRSDPEFKPTTLFLRTRTKRTAVRLLEDRGEDKDLSELVEELLTEWNGRK